MAVPISELQSVAPSAVIELFTLELNVAQHGIAETYRFHAGTNVSGGNLVWAGNTYLAMAIEASGFEYSGNGQLPRPKIRVSNTMGTITALILSLPNGLEGAKVTRIRTMARYLDAVNFPARRNLYVYTENFTASGWTVANATMTANAALAPDGTMTANKMENTSTIVATRQVYRQVTAATLDPVTYSVYVKAAERSFVRLQLVATGAFVGTSYLVAFDLSTGIITGTVGLVTGTITDAGNGWYRCSISATPVATGVVRGSLIPVATANGTSGYIENIGWGPYAWGAQLEFATEPSEYQPITGAAFTGNPYGTPDPTAEFPSEVFFLDRKSAETREVVEFEMCSAFDLANVRAPKRQCIANICPWVYRSAECSYSRPGYYDINNNPVGSLALDVCNKRLDGCETRLSVFTRVGTVTVGSNVLTLASTVSILPGDLIRGWGLPTGTTVNTVTSSTTLALSANATASSSASKTGTASATAATLTVANTTGLAVGMAVAGTYMNGATIAGISGTALTLSGRPYSFTRSGTYDVIPGFMYSNPPDKVKLTNTTGIVVGMRVFGSLGINTTVAAVSAGVSITLSVAPPTPTDGALVTVYFMPASPAAETYTFTANTTYAFRDPATELPYGGYPGVGASGY